MCWHGQAFSAWRSLAGTETVDGLIEEFGLVTNWSKLLIYSFYSLALWRMERLTGERIADNCHDVLRTDKNRELQRMMLPSEASLATRNVQSVLHSVCVAPTRCTVNTIGESGFTDTRG